jgi:hypothetical protein
VTKWFYLSNLFSLLLAAAANSAGTDGVYFYRTTQSLFPSGQASKKLLQKNKVRAISENTYLVTRDRKTFWIAADKILRVSDLADDTAINVIHCSLRKGPDWNTESLIQVPPLTRLEILKFENSWALVRFQSVGASMTGYVDLNNLIVKADFASFVLTEKNEWRPVKYRELSHLVTDQGDRIPIDSIQRMRTRSELGIVAVREDKLGLSLKNHVLIQKIEGGSWILSDLKGHGQIYWKDKPETFQGHLSVELQDTFDTDSLLKKEIHSVAFHPKNPNWGLVSAHGIYMTTDGERWAKISQFQNQNHAVSIDKDGTMIVGSFQSKNFGKSFQSFLRWEKIARLIEINESKPPQQMNLVASEFDENGFLILTIDNGVKKIKVRGLPEETNSWRME